MGKLLFSRIVYGLLLITTSQVNANQLSGYCGIVSTNTLYLQQNEYGLLFKGDNGFAQTYKKLSPGTHKLSAYITGQGGRGNSNMTINIGINKVMPTSRVVEFYINVEANNKYLIIAEKVPNPKKEGSVNKFIVKIKKQSTKQCNAQELVEDNIETTHTSNMAPEQNHVSTLPKNLTYRIGLLTKEIRDYFATKGIYSDVISLSQPNRVSTNIGIITDINDNETKGIKVLSVSPYSIAAELGVESNDIITRVNQTDLTSLSEKKLSVKALKQAISNVAVDQNLTVNVNRKGISKTLSTSYDAINIPAYKLQIEINN